MTNESNEDLIAKLLDGELTEREMEQLAERLDSDSEVRRELVEQSQFEVRLTEALSLQSELPTFETLGVSTGSESSEPLLNATPSTHRERGAFSIGANDVWKWASGMSTMAAVFLLTLLVLSIPPQPTALAYPSLGKLDATVSWNGENIWGATKRGDLSNLQTAIEAGDSVDARLNKAFTPLHIAAMFDQREATKLLLKHGAELSLADEKGNTALHMAAFLGNTEIVQQLLSAGANTELRNHDQFNAQDLVAITWNSELESYYGQLEEFLGSKLNLSKIRAERPIIQQMLTIASPNPPSAANQVNIWEAVVTGNSNVIEAHITAESDLNQKEAVGGSTPLMLAAVFDQPEAAQRLIEAGADLELRNNSQDTALHLACFFARPEIANMLLDAGADTSKRNLRHRRPDEVVAVEWSPELEGIYRHVFESLNLKLELAEIQSSRAEIVTLFKDHHARNP